MVKKAIKTFAEGILVSVVALLFMVGMFLLYAWTADDPTMQIKEKTYTSQRADLKKLDTPELHRAKSMFKEAMAVEGLTVDDSYIRIWSDHGLTTISYYWQSGDTYYKTEVLKTDHDRAYTAAGVIEGVFTQDDILSAKYDKESGYLFVDTTPLHDYDFFYIA